MINQSVCNWNVAWSGCLTVFKQRADQPIFVSPAEIDVRQADTVSIMPQDLIKNLTVQELADVIAYLSTLKGTDK